MRISPSLFSPSLSDSQLPPIFESLPQEIQFKIAKTVLAQAKTPIPYFLVSKTFYRVYQDVHLKNVVDPLLRIHSTVKMVKDVEDKNACRLAIVEGLDHDRLIFQHIQTAMGADRWEEELKTVESLLRAGCNPNILSDSGNSLLSLILNALDFTKPELFERVEKLFDLLLRFGADPNGNIMRPAPLYLAIEQIPNLPEGQVLQMKLVKLLCEKGAKPDRQTKVDGIKRQSIIDDARKRYPYAATVLEPFCEKQKPSFFKRVRNFFSKPL